ncbi:alkaline phosphatase [Trypanosoma rangeli]|uniref:Alkaline phosphatase n=1 Tax=Trypanosoma rangeli TaxID=5698 RepID=A0A422P0L9_TRYRA|nr:alkaline phosphatase [Trypanosoma rangeli]RNF11266.1 alkaline phosphatase [Trypanosoma rangeli]|eukprot:RNF11266.1 alkaline phosphatase [Trypanosoma rangeli]
MAATVKHREHVRELNKSPRLDTGGCVVISTVGALVWFGDAAFGDNCSLLQGCYSSDNFKLIRSKFVKQRNAPEDAPFRQTCMHHRTTAANLEEGDERQCVMGVCDYHDLGKNDGGAKYAGKDVTHQFLLDLIEVAKSGLRRKQKGVYYFEAIPFWVLDTNFQADYPMSTAVKEPLRLYDHAMRFLLLDVRHFRNPANPHCSGDILCETQWK